MKLDPSEIDKLEELYQEFLERHRESGQYAPNTIRIREGHAHAFLLFLRGEYDPATDYMKRRK